MPSTNKLSLNRVIAKFLLSFCGITSFGVFSILTLSTPVSATNTTNTASVTIPGSIAVRLLDSTATSEISYLGFDLTPTPTGTSQTKRTIVDVGTSNPTGYKLYMQSNYQVGGNYTTNLVHTDSSVTDVISTNTTSSSLYWNYVNPLLNTTSVIPEHGHPDKIAQHFDTINSDQIPVDINVSVDNTIVSGTYQNQLLFSAVGNPTSIAYKLHFNTGSGTMTGEDIEETATAWTDTITIPGDPSTSNYTNYIPTGVTSLFTGWTISIPTGSTATATCNGTNICHPGDNINITGGINQAGDMVGEVNLTANYTSVSNMQAMTPTICSTAATGAATTLADTRDSNTYTIRKLKDGNCWMTQNLRLVGPRTLTLANSDVALDYGLTASDDSTWCTDQTAECYNQSMVLNSGNNDYGTYYNWYAATASTGTYELSSGNATSSVCPKGWRMPTGGENSELQTLYNQYPSSEALREVAGPALVLSGFRLGDTTRQGANSGYWSSTTASNYAVYYLILNSSEVYPANRSFKYYGFPVRCLAQTTTKSVLGVDPNGGTWNGSTKGQTFTGTAGETKTISNPTASYTITYNDNSQGTTYTASPASVDRLFTGWSFTGAGSFAGGVYEYGTGNAQLKASYATTSDTFTLPEITKSGDYMGCKWAEGSPSGTQYYSGETRTISSDTTYYAVCGTITKMQEMTPTICANTATRAQVTLVDIRDNNSYIITKLGDGNCWMNSDELRLVGPRTLTSADSNVTSDFYLPAENSSWCTTNDESCVNSSYVLLRTTSGSANLLGTTAAYYNWYTATAGSGTYSITSGNADSSVCPKGWRLPVGGDTSSEFSQYLFNYAFESNGRSSFHYTPGWKGTSVATQYPNRYFVNTSSATAYTYYGVTYYNNDKFSNAISSTKYADKTAGATIRCLAQ